MSKNTILVLSIPVILGIIISGTVFYSNYIYCKKPPPPSLIFSESVGTSVPFLPKSLGFPPGPPPDVPLPAPTTTPGFSKWLERCAPKPAVAERRREEEKIAETVTKKFFCYDNPREVAILKTPYHFEKDTYGDERGVGYVTVKGKITVQTRRGLRGDYQSIDFFADENAKNESPESKLFYEAYKTYNIYGSFQIGKMIDGRIETTAELDTNTEENILSAIRSGEPIALTFYIPFGEYDFGLPDHFSPACRIQTVH